MIKEKIVEILKQVTGSDEVLLSFSDRLEHGDYMSNVSLQLAKDNPRKYATDLVSKLEQNPELKSIIEKIEVAGPGFINFFLSKDYLQKELRAIIEEKGRYGSSDLMKGKKVIIEFTDPNPFKELHIGHLYSNIVGESLSRLLEATGATLKRACYQGDVGLHVAKSIWGMKKKLTATSIDEIEKLDISERVKFLGEAYALGSSSFEEDETAKNEIIKINTQVFDKDAQIMNLYSKGRQWSLEYFDSVYARVGTNFDYFFFESEVSQDGVLIVKEYLSKGVFEESEGAVIFPGEKYGLHTRVFLNSLGLPTYEAKELGLAPYKYKKFPYDLSIVVTANEINEYFKVLLKALSLINPELASKTIHIGHGFVKLPDGKMSSRTGNVITAEKVLDNAHKYALNIQQGEKNEDTAEMIGQAAIKYTFLKNNIGSDIEFDLEKSVTFNGNSGPYLQYTAVRIKSLLAKAEDTNFSEKETQELDQDEINLVRYLSRFSEVIMSSASEYKLSLLCEYLFDLSQRYNLFYDSKRILGEDREEVRLKISVATLSVLENGLKLLGIQIPSKM